MSLSAYIKNKTPIDIDLGSNRDEVYSGICVKQNEELFVLLELDEESGSYDGFLLFRNADIESYREWDEDDYQDLVGDNSDDRINRFDFSELNSFEGAFQFLKNQNLVSLYTDEEDDFYVGKIKECSSSHVVIDLIDEDGSSLGEDTFDLDEIDIIGFDSSYEKSFI